MDVRLVGPCDHRPHLHNCEIVPDDDLNYDKTFPDISVKVRAKHSISLTYIYRAISKALIIF